MHFLGIEIGGSKLQVVAGTGNGRILDRRRFTVERAAGGDGIRSQLAGALPDLMRRWNPETIGVGFGGPVRWQTGELTCSHHIAGWEEFPLGAWLQERTGIPATVDNDANVAALGEATNGAGLRHRVVFYVTLGSGVGGGLVVEGRIYHGASPGELEIGHMRLDRTGTIVEDRCSGWAMDRRIREVIAEPANVHSDLARLVAETGPGSEARQLAVAMARGDSLAGNVLDEHAGYLGFALSHVAHLLHPDIIVLGGGLSLLGESLRSRVAASLPRFLMQAFQPGPNIALASLGEDVVPVGALVLASTYQRNHPAP